MKATNKEARYAREHLQYLIDLENRDYKAYFEWGKGFEHISVKDLLDDSDEDYKFNTDEVIECFENWDIALFCNNDDSKEDSIYFPESLCGKISLAVVLGKE